MNHDDNTNTTNTLAPELEARVVAWIAGEASAFEAAELERLATEKPEIAIFRRRMHAVQGLLAEAIRPDTVPLRLSAERRAKLLVALGAVEAKAPKRLKAPIMSLDDVWRAQRKHQKWILRIAACLVLGLFFAMLTPSFHKLRESPSREVSLVGGARHEGDQAVYLSVAPSAPDFEAKQKAATESEKRALEEDVPSRNARLAQMERIGAEQARRRALRTEMPAIAIQTPAAPEPAGSMLGYVADSAPAQKRDYGNAPASNGADLVAGIAGSSEESIVLSPFSVSTAKEGKSYAKTERRQEVAMKELAAVDQFGNVAQHNVGDLMKQLPGLPKGAGGELAAPAAAPIPLPVVVVEKTAEISVAKEPVSTFSLHVSDVSFKIAKAALANGTAIDRERIRPEEFYNAFNYGDQAPALNEKISCHIEQAAHPLLQQRNLVRIAMKVAAAGRGAGQPLRLTVLLDTSGSMEREDRAAAVRRAMRSLISLLGPDDTVTLIGFARQPRLLAENVSGDKANELLAILGSTPAEGGTNLEEALKLGSELAQRHFDEAAQNRIVLLTDGAANLGNADRTQLAEAIEELREEGIAFDACGVGMEGLDDGMLEALSRKGDGRYYVLNSAEDADAGFARQLAGALRPAAKNVKVQVRFNPARVGSYRLIGFEQHRLREEDFRNDKVDAAELAAEEAAVAVYQVEPLPQGEGELGEVYVRFLDPSTGNMVERSWTLPYDSRTPAFDRASPSMQLAGTAALLAETLQRGGKEDVARLNELTPVINALPDHFPNADRVDDLVEMFEQLKKQSAK